MKKLIYLLLFLVSFSAIGQGTGIFPPVNTSGTDTYTAPAPSGCSPCTSYVNNGLYRINFGIANTGASTLNINSAGAKSIVTSSGSAVSSGILIGMRLLLYDGTNFQIIGDGTVAGGTTPFAFTFSSSAPANTYVAWVDTGNAFAGAYPIRNYVNGAWTAVTDECNYWDPIGLVISKGRPIPVLASGQSNVGAALYYPADANGYTGDVATDKHVTYWNNTAGAFQVYQFGSLANPFDATVGATQIHIYAKLLAKETGRSVRLVVTREPGVPLKDWEAGGTAWTTLTARITASGISFFDKFLWIHGEAELGTPSAFSNYQDSFYDFISRLRALSGANPKMKVLFSSSAGGMLLTTNIQTSAEGTARGLNGDNDVNTHWVKIMDSKEAQFGASDAFHFTTREHEKMGQAFYGVDRRESGFSKQSPPVNVTDTYTGNLLTSRTISHQNIDLVEEQFQSYTSNAGQMMQAYGFGGNNTFPSKMGFLAAGNGVGSFQIWHHSTNTNATSANLVFKTLAAGVRMAAPSNTALHAMITSTANNSGDAALTFNHDATIEGTSLWGRTGIVARATGGGSQANLYFYGGTTAPSTANLVTDTRLFLNLSTTATSLTLGNNATPIATLGAVQPALSGAQLLPALRINAGAHTTGNTGEKIDWYFNGARTVNMNTGAITTWRSGYFAAPTISFVGASVITNAYGLYLDSPVASTNATITNNAALGLDGNLRFISIGNGIYIKEGTNGAMNVATLVGGTVTVSNTRVTANSRIMVFSQVDGGTPGFLRVSTRTAGTSFTITSSSGTDTSTVAWIIIEPN